MILFFEYLPYDLGSLIGCGRISNNPLLIKNVLRQILQGVAYCHSKSIIHRDLKPANVLVERHTNTVKIADFGLSRTFEVDHQDYTAEVGSLWYRAPECVVGDRRYSSTTVNLWSVGCIFGELVTRKPLFAADFVIPLLDKYFGLLGNPDRELEVEYSTEGCLSLFKTIEYKELANEFLGLEPAGVDLLSKLVRLHPDERITAKDALEHEYFKD